MKISGTPPPSLNRCRCHSDPVPHPSYDTWIPASEIEASVEDPPTPEKPRKVPGGDPQVFWGEGSWSPPPLTPWPDTATPVPGRSTPSGSWTRTPSTSG